MTSNGDQDQQQAVGTTRGEWALGLLGALVAAALVAFLGYQALVRDGGPHLEVAVTDVEESAGTYVVSVAVRNDGGQTAEGVVVTGQVVDDGRAIESASTTLNYVPPDSTRDAALVFTSDPRGPSVDLAVAVTGYAPM